MTANRLELTLDFPGQRLDRALATVWPELSRVQWQKLIREEGVLINGKPSQASFRLRGDEVAVATIPDIVDVDIVGENIPLDIRYEDDDLLVVNKPAGMVVHPSIGTEKGTLVNAILYHCPELLSIGNEKRPGIVHRLDKETSGLLVVAKNDMALRALQEQFKQRTIHKAYLTLVVGHIRPERALIDAPIGRDPKNRQRMTVIPPQSKHFARSAKTSYELVTDYGGYSLVRCTLHTGRTHQIRVHLGYIGFPIVGDPIYGRKRNLLLKGRQFLHSAELGFKHPRTGEEMQFSAELPPELQAVLDKLILAQQLA